MSIDRFHTPLRYPGGKGKFAPFIKHLMESNNIVGGHYLEPYAGGAGVALDLLFSGFCSDIHINDLDLSIYNFWKSITTTPDEFLRLLNDTPITTIEREKQKLILDNPDSFSYVEHGFAAFFLNRTNRSGILKGGVIGGKNQSGIYKIDARFNKVGLANRIKKIADQAQFIHVSNEDALTLLEQVDTFLPQNSLIYLDPPYYVKGQGLYRNFYQHKDHENIRNALANIKTNWIVSYDSNNAIKEMYEAYRQDEYFLNYSAYHKTKGSEVMIFCDALHKTGEQLKTA